MSERRTLKILYECERKGFAGKGDVVVKLTLESFNGARYAMWATYDDPNGKPSKATSIRLNELGALIAALQTAQADWEIPDESFSGDLSHADYAKLLTWSVAKTPTKPDS